MTNDTIGTRSERLTYDTLVRHDLWLSADQLATLTGLPLCEVLAALAILVESCAVARDEFTLTYRVC